MKKCPFCEADIEESARFCLYCMQSLTEKEQIVSHKKKKAQWLIIVLIALLLLAVLAFFGWHISRGSEPVTTDPPHVHTYSVKNMAIKYQKEASSCVAPAVYYYSCDCGERGSETFSYGELGEHVIVTDAGYPASCNAEGLTDGAHCSICNLVFVSQSTIAEKAHTFDNDRDDTCNVCGYVRVLNCDHSETVTLSAVPPTCTAGGMTEGKKCALCDELLIPQTVLGPNGHTDAIDKAVDPTCTENGKTEGKHCAVCNTVLVYQQIIPSPGHSYDSGDPEAPCSVCGAEPPHAHSFVLQNVSERYIKDEASCLGPATYYYSCTCGEKGSETFKHGTRTACQIATEPGYPATCTATGLTDKKYCPVCQDVFERHEEIPVEGHEYMLGDTSPTCLVCGEEGTVIVEGPEMPLVLNDAVRVNSCTYTVLPSVEEKWKFTFYLNITNIGSQAKSSCPEGSVTPEGSYGVKCSYINDHVLEPGESGDCALSVRVTNSATKYTLDLRWW